MSGFVLFISGPYTHTGTAWQDGLSLYLEISMLFWSLCIQNHFLLLLCSLSRENWLTGCFLGLIKNGSGWDWPMGHRGVRWGHGGGGWKAFLPFPQLVKLDGDEWDQMQVATHIKKENKSWGQSPPGVGWPFIQNYRQKTLRWSHAYKCELAFSNTGVKKELRQPASCWDHIYPL